MDIIKRFPFFGCGYNAYIQTLKKLTLYPVEYPHNSLLQIGAELGLIGLAAHLYFFISLFFYGLRTLKDMAHNSSMYILAVGVFLSIFAWLVHSFLDTPWQSLLLSILWWLLIGILLSLRTVAQHMELNRKRG
jgi:O-antigen ligase